MKSMFRQVCCMVLVASLLLQTVPMALAQGSLAGGPLSGVRNELLEARRILTEDSSGKKSQDAVPSLDRAKQLAGDPAFARSFTGSVSEFRQKIEKARLKVLWNDRTEALSIVNRLLGLVDSAAKKPAPQTPCGNGPGASAAFGAALFAGLGGLLLFLFIQNGQVSHR